MHNLFEQTKKHLAQTASPEFASILCFGTLIPNPLASPLKQIAGMFWTTQVQPTCLKRWFTLVSVRLTLVYVGFRLLNIGSRGFGLFCPRRLLTRLAQFIIAFCVPGVARNNADHH